MVGQHIGKYRVTEQIGRGGMGTVYRAIDETLHREVAIKVLNAELNDPTVARRFRAEAVTIARLNHPGIATIYELLQHDGQWLMVMEFLRGETLEALVARSGPQPLARAADLVMQSLSALAHAHSLGVVHRDLKPANLMIADNGLVKVMDFGIARVAGGEQLTSAGFMMGTPAYMAPEQVLGQEIDARTDLYATGLVFYYLISGTLPFAGRTPLEQAQARIQDAPAPIRTARPDVPAWVSQVLDIALARAPEQRFQTALLFREALRRGLANLPIETPPPSAVPPELVATAAPGALPVVPSAPPAGTAGARAPAAAPPPAVTKLDVPKAPPAPVRAPTTAGPESVAAGAPAAVRRRPPVAALAVAIIALAAGAWWVIGRGGPATPAASADPPSSPAPGASSSGTPPAGSAPGAASSPANPYGPDPAASSAPGPTPGPAAGASAASPSPAVAPAGTAAGPVVSGPPATPGAPGAAAPPPAGSADALRGSTRGRGADAADAPVVVRGARAFLVTGRKVDEQDAILSFGGGRVSLSDEKGQKLLGAMSYADITAVAHTRDKNPRWYPTLAAPPGNVDLPGGLFRSDRHWFSFQSRAGYLIVRVNDNDVRRVTDAARARLKAKVETLPPR